MGGSAKTFYFTPTRQYTAIMVEWTVISMGEMAGAPVEARMRMTRRGSLHGGFAAGREVRPGGRRTAILLFDNG